MEIHGLEDFFDFEDEKICHINNVITEAGGVTVSEEGEEIAALLVEKHVEEAEEELRRREKREERRERKMFQGIRKTLSNNREKLEDLYSSEIEVGSMKQRRYFDLLKFVLNFLTEQMKLVAPEFSRRVAEIYCGGSFFDGLKTDSQPQEFDMNIIIHFNPDYFHLCQLGFFEGKENFCFLKAGGPKGCPNSMQEYVDFISPLDLFKELLSSVDKVIAANRHLVEDPEEGLRYRITRSVGAPVTLKVKGIDDDLEFEVDLVPALKTRSYNPCNPATWACRLRATSPSL